ncbi:hypothetical protein ACP179_21245 [Xenorhabdus stockiae]|uniref:hypothetical protein n=1 Tax=Xenorhabdus stockiae TaxID=351614 RepID=UPI003CE721F8
MANSDIIKIDFQGDSILQGSSVVMNVTYTGDSSHIVTDTTKMQCSITSKNSNVTVDNVKANSMAIRNKSDNTITVPYQIVVNVEDDPQKIKDIQLEFSVDIADSHTETSTYHQIKKEDINARAFSPMIMNSNVVIDYEPMVGNIPGANNKYVEISLHARKSDGSALKNYQIILVVDNIGYIRLFNEDGTREISISQYPENNHFNIYRINTDNNGDITLRIYPKSQSRGYVRAISTYVELGFSEAVNTESMLFITEQQYPQSDMVAPRIEEMDGIDLTPPDPTINIFHVIPPPYNDATAKDKLFIMNRNQDGDLLCKVQVVGNTRLLGSAFVEVPYDAITQIGNNTLYYYVANEVGEARISEELPFYLVSQNPNKPPQVNPTLEQVTIFDGLNVRISSPDGRISLDSIIGGLKCRIPIGGNHQVKEGNTVQVNLYINAFLPLSHIPHPHFFSLPPQKIGADDRSKGHIDIHIDQGYLSGCDADAGGSPGVIYITYSDENQNTSYEWQAQIDTVPPGWIG